MASNSWSLVASGVCGTSIGRAADIDPGGKLPLTAGLRAAGCAIGATADVGAGVVAATGVGVGATVDTGAVATGATGGTIGATGVTGATGTTAGGLGATVAGTASTGTAAGGFASRVSVAMKARSRFS